MLECGSSSLSFPKREIIHIVEIGRNQRQENLLALRRARKRKQKSRTCLAFPCVCEILADTDLLRAGSSGAAYADVGDLDVGLRQTRLPLQLAHGRVGCSAAGAHGSHYWLALGTTLACSDPLPIDCALLVEAALRRFAGILFYKIERSYDFRRDYSYFCKLFQKSCFFFFKTRTALYKWKKRTNI